MNIILIGSPGCGKSVQGKFLEESGYNLVIAGDMLREEKVSGSDIGDEIAGIIDRGNLVPNHMINQLIERYLTEENIKKDIVFDGYPRKIAQAEFIQSLVDLEIIDSLNHVFYIDVPEDMITERILERAKTSGRKDDQSIDIIKKRMDSYRKETEPLVEYYKEKNVLRTINGSLSIKEVQKHIKSFLK